MTQQSQHRSQRIDDGLAHAFGVSRQGTGREENQDGFAIDDHVWMVADGMGGHDGGRLASAVAVATATLNVAPDADLVEVVDLCHVTVLTAGQVADSPDMGSTLVLAVRDPERGTVQVAWCGDSRAYVLVDGQLRRLTTDHNVAEEERAAGVISAEEVHDHPGQGILTSALGCGSVDTPTIGLVELDSRGRLLLCTDGLTAGLRDDDIASLLSVDGLTDAADSLVAAAAAAGSTDDTTVVIVDLERELMEEPTSTDAEGELEHVVEAVTALGAKVTRTRGEVVDFQLGRASGIAYDKGGQLLRASFFLDLGDIDLDEAISWVEAQPRSRTGSLEVGESDGQVLLRLLVERVLPLEDGDAAVIAAEASSYADAWRERRTLAAADLPSPRHAPPSVLTRQPQDAWLLYGSRRSVFGTEERAGFMLDWEEGIHSVNWTVPKHARPGDLVWIYFKAPLKEIRYAARVASHPYFDPQLIAEADRPLAAQQWWAWLTPLQEVGPVPLATLQEIAGERLVGRVHGGTYLRPEVSNALVDLVSSGPAAGEGIFQEQVCRRLGHRDGLPDPETMGWQEWQTLPAQQLRLEVDVERYVRATSAAGGRRGRGGQPGAAEAAHEAGA
ncbi:PP2C family protein-serine/threonine phosphatase [Ornithinimicrobium sp. W1665]|uniref:PP2C family protein-serine/threonine phosphatase n=1 Tax=Ornithinimicrobium sp. W1665 TaxID=3416666 RepID=UPI003D6B2DAA